MLPRLFNFPQLPVLDTRHSDMSMDTWTPILSQKYVKFSEYFQVRGLDIMH